MLSRIRYSSSRSQVGHCCEAPHRPILSPRTSKERSGKVSGRSRQVLFVAMLEQHGAFDSPLPGQLQQGRGAMTDSTTASVVSKDGTQITYDRLGFGPPLVVVAGALGLRKSSFVRPWVKALASTSPCTTTTGVVAGTVATR